MHPRRLERALCAASLACAIAASFAPASQAATPVGAVQQAYAKASNTGFDDQFGYSVAISGDTMVIGAPYEDSSATGVNGDGTNDDASNSGAAYVFTRTGTTWTQQAYLKASNTGALDLFGTSVAISGETIVIGAAREDSSATVVNGDGTNNGTTDSGAAYVFTRSGIIWTQQAYLKASNTGVADRFGNSVGISGETIVIGAPLEDSSATGVNGDGTNDSATSSGAAYVFTRSGIIWTQQAYLKASNTGAGDQFAGAGSVQVSGTSLSGSVAISGETIVIGAAREASSATGVNGDETNNGASDSGAAYVFTRTGTTWTQQAYLKASNTGVGDFFGASVAISGETIVIGAPRVDNSRPDSGAAYVFSRSAGTWTQQAYLEASDTGLELDDFDRFGNSVAISGETIVIGAALENNMGIGWNDSGAAYVFTRSAGTWTERAYLRASNAEWSAGEFGTSVAVSGETTVIGAPSEDTDATGVNDDGANSDAPDSGAAYVFVPKTMTQTTLTCAPDARQVGQASTCTAQVTGSSPTGTVDFSAEGPGSLGASSCTLTSGSCSVTYTPSGVGDGTQTVTASYQGDAVNETSSGTDDVTVKAITQTALTCAPDARQVGQASTCTAQVTGQSPTGTVDFSAEGPGNLGSPSCTLTAGSCSVTYTPSGVGDGTQTVTASYQGDAVNETSSGTDDVTVSAPSPPASTPASCDGAEATILGTTGPDKLIGTDGPDVIQALGGNDHVNGLGANDTICGGRGDDTLRGGGGHDTLFGGAGKDLLLGGPDLDRLFGGSAGTTTSAKAVDHCPGSDEDRRHGCRAHGPG